MTQPPTGDQPAGYQPTGDVPTGNPSPPYGPTYGSQPGHGPAYGAPPGYGYPPGPYGYQPHPYGYPPQGYGYQPHAAGPPQDKPSSNIGWAIAAIFLFWPLAIPSFIYAGKVDSSWNMGDRAGAQSASRSAKQYGLIAVIVGAVLLVLLVIWFIVIFAFVADTVRHIPTVTVPPSP